MATQSLQEVEGVLRSTLGEQTECHLETLTGGKVSGNVVSEMFEGKDNAERQRLMWSALDARFREDAPHRVGVLLAYTPDEWNVTLQD